MPLAPLGCAVQIFESRDRCSTWTEHTTNGLYIGASNEHYQCHKIYVNKMRSVRISDTVFFKHKHITQPTSTQVDIIVKAIDDLTHARKERKNLKRIAQTEALERIDEILNNHSKATETNLTIRATSSTLQNRLQQSLTDAIIDRPTTMTPTPRMQATNKTPIVNTKPPTPRVQAKSTKELSPQRIKLCSHIHKATANRARLLQHYNGQLHQEEQRERVQLIHDQNAGHTSTIDNSSMTQNTQNYG
jgi:hypothetical protein